MIDPYTTQDIYHYCIFIVPGNEESTFSGARGHEDSLRGKIQTYELLSSRHREFIVEHFLDRLAFPEVEDIKTEAQLLEVVTKLIKSIRSECSKVRIDPYTGRHVRVYFLTTDLPGVSLGLDMRKDYPHHSCGTRDPRKAEKWGADLIARNPELKGHLTIRSVESHVLDPNAVPETFSSL